MMRAALIAIATLLAFPVLAASPFGTPVAAGCQTALCNADTLEPYFEKLLEAAKHNAGSKPVHILQIGDSHTAGDAITGGWRDLLQARYGSGGRGVLPPGRPYQGFLAYGATISMSPGWTVKSTFGRDSSDPRPPIGLSGFSLTSQKDRATISLTADAGEAFDRFVICALAKPGASSLAIQIGFNTIDFDLSSFATRTECKTIRTPEAQLTAQVTALGGPVTITSWATFRDAGGVVVSNLGVVGSQLVHFGRTDDAVVSEEMRSYRPDLIVIAFGTNEGFSPRVEPSEYEIVLRSQISRIRRLAGNVPILMLGAPDANTRNAGLAANAPASPIDCNARTQSIEDIVASVAPFSDGSAPQAPMQANPAIADRPLFVPPGLGVVREIQRRVATSLNIAFWDWQARMGGACSASRFVRAETPLMRGDFVHFTKAGGWEIARMLQGDLVAAQSALAKP
jgi:lysophospholipase L1-like esterase